MRCVIISGSPEADINFIKASVKPDDYVICADKGSEYAALAGITPNLIVSDYDSCNIDYFPDCEKIVLNTHKDDTDTMHSIDIALERGFFNIIILGATGGRLDHTIANLSALQYIHINGGKGLIVSDFEQIEYLTVGTHCFSGHNGRTFSLFPFGCDEVCVSYSGAEYPLEKYSIKSSIPLGVSNRSVSENLIIDIYDGNAILIINLKDC